MRKNAILTADLTCRAAFDLYEFFNSSTLLSLSQLILIVNLSVIIFAFLYIQMRKFSLHLNISDTRECTALNKDILKSVDDFEVLLLIDG